MISLNTKKFFGAFILASLVALVSAHHAQAGVLQPSYQLLAPVVGASAGVQTGSVTISGMVTALPGQQATDAELRFKTNIVGQSFVTEHPIFSPITGGAFDRTLTGFTCGQTYRFFLYEMPDPNVTGSTETLINWGSSVGFDYVMSCGSSQASGGDIMAPTSAGANNIAGVNWGNIVSTDSSISISGAHLLPLPPTNVPKSFHIDYGAGTGTYGQSPTTSSYIGSTNPQIAYPPSYSFNASIPGLMPNTDYYFTLVETGVPGSGDGADTNLLTYGYAPTNFLTGAGLQETFPNATTFKVFGHLQSANGTVYYNLPIQIVIKDSNNQVLMTNNLVTGPQSQFASGNFESIFNNITSAGLVPGQSYTYTIMNATPGDVYELTTPQSFTVPTPFTPNTTATVTEPEYDGLVACGLNPELYDCNFNTFLETVNRVMNFLILFVAFPCVALVIAWAGLQLIISGGSSEARTSAKSAITKVVIGLVVALLAWVIIKLVLVVFGYTPTGPLWQILGTTP